MMYASTSVCDLSSHESQSCIQYRTSNYFVSIQPRGFIVVAMAAMWSPTAAAATILKNMPLDCFFPPPGGGR